MRDQLIDLRTRHSDAAVTVEVVDNAVVMVAVQHVNAELVTFVLGRTEATAIAVALRDAAEKVTSADG